MSTDKLPENSCRKKDCSARQVGKAAAVAGCSLGRVVAELREAT